MYRHGCGAAVGHGAGQLVIQGYGGEYELAITYDGETWHKTVHIREQQDNETIIQLTGD